MFEIIPYFILFKYNHSYVIGIIYPVAGNIISWKDGIGKNLVLMLFTGIVAFLVLNMIEYGLLRIIKQFLFRYIKRTYPSNASEVDDDDVSAERDRINNMTEQELKSETLVMKNVSKFYGKFCAVNKMFVSIKRYSFTI